VHFQAFLREQGELRVWTAGVYVWSACHAYSPGELVRCAVADRSGDDAEYLRACQMVPAGVEGMCQTCGVAHARSEACPFPSRSTRQSSSVPAVWNVSDRPPLQGPPICVVQCDKQSYFNGLALVRAAAEDHDCLQCFACSGRGGGCQHEEAVRRAYLQQEVGQPVMEENESRLRHGRTARVEGVVADDLQRLISEHKIEISERPLKSAAVAKKHKKKDAAGAAAAAIAKPPSTTINQEVSRRLASCNRSCCC
jgi:hypothetical protein